MPINLPQIDVLCIGSGGGSIARVDQFGSLTVGPASAGAEPGPAAYGLGGEDATVTDAHVVLGNLSAESALADGVPLDRELAERAVAAAVGEPLGLGVEEAAAAILRIANANMANALRVMTIARGHDPRRFALVAIGGAGPMHACALADELGIPRVVIPRYPGVAAALGLLATDIRHDLRRSWLQPTAAIAPRDLDAEFARLEAEAADLLETSASVTRSFEFSHELDMRYRGQAYNLTVPFAPRPVTAETIAAAEAAFEEEHRRLYDYTPTVTETDIVTLRLRALARIPDIDWTVAEDGRRAAVAGTRRVYHGGWREWTAAGARCARAGRYDRRRDDHRAGGHDRGDPTRLERTRRRGGHPGAAARGGLMSTQTAIDPITMEILASGFHHIAEEMAVVEYRSSYSPIIREMLDFNCGLFTGDGRMVANSEQIPAQLGLMQFALEAAREKWGDDIAEGDAVLTNHPYMGGTHTPDLQVFTPLYRDGRIIAWAGSIAHHIDIGGRFPGTESAQCTELFQEGLIFPAVKLVERGTRVRALYDLIGANVRDPASTLGDLDAQLAACRRGMARVDELADAHGTDTVLQGMETLLHTTALRAEAAFRSWPERTVDGRGLPRRRGLRGHRRRCACTPPCTSTTARWWSTCRAPAAQIASGMNVPISSAHAGTYFAVRAFLGPEVPQNAGLTSRVRVIAPEGTVFNPIFPAALSARHLAVQRLSDVLIEALCELLPERSVAASHVSFPALVFQAVDPRSGRLTLLADILGGGGGARRDAPGDDGIDPYCSNCAILPAEIAELEYPWRIERTELVEGSGGAGRMRGGMGLRRDYRLLADVSDGMYYVEQTVPEFAARGREGGGSRFAWKGNGAAGGLRGAGTGHRQGIHPPVPRRRAVAGGCGWRRVRRGSVRGCAGAQCHDRGGTMSDATPEDGGGTTPSGDTAPAAESASAGGGGGGGRKGMSRKNFLQGTVGAGAAGLVVGGGVGYAVGNSGSSSSSSRRWRQHRRQQLQGHDQGRRGCSGHRSLRG